MAAKEATMNASMSHGGGLFVQLQDVVFAAECLNDTSENEDPATSLTPRVKWSKCAEL